MQDLTRQGAESAQGLTTQGYGQARQDVGAGYDAAGQQIQDAQGFYDPYAQAGQQSMGYMQDVAGTGFEESDMLNRRINRAQMGARERLGSMGMSGSGEDVLAETGMGDEIYTQEMQRQQARQDQMNMALYGGGMQAAGGQASLASQGAGYEAQRGTAYGNLDTAQANALANNEQDLYGRLADLQGGRTQSQADLQQQMDLGRQSLYGQEASAMAGLDSQYYNNLQAIEGTTSAGTANIRTGVGNANAASTMAQGGAWQNALQGVSRAAGDYLQTRRPQQQRRSQRRR